MLGVFVICDNMVELKHPWQNFFGYYFTLRLTVLFINASLSFLTRSQLFYPICILFSAAFSPTSMFVLAMVAIFLLAAVIHPQEFFNIVYGKVTKLLQ